MQQPPSHEYMSPFVPVTLSTLSLRDLPNGKVHAAAIPSGVDHWHRFATSYREAGDVLVGSMTRSRQLSVLGAPMMFMYRHYVEIHLKSLLLDAGELLDDPQTVQAKHFLLILWRRVRVLLLKISPESDGPWFERADLVIQQLDELDPTSFVFRYPVDKLGQPSLPEEVFVDPIVVQQVIAELSILLDGASTQICEYTNLKHAGY